MPAIAFDIDDTLYDLAGPYRKAMTEVFGTYRDLPVDDLFRRTRVLSDVAYELVLSGEKPVEYMHVFRIKGAFAEIGVDISDDVALAFQRSYERHQRSISMSPQVRAMLRECVRSGWHVGVISNGDSAHQWEKVDLLGVCDVIDRERVVISGDVGFSKPSVEVFRVAESLLGAAAGECWFVGDTYENDIAGSLGAGWHCIWFNRRGRALANGERLPDIVVKTEAEMACAVTKLVAR